MPGALARCTKLVSLQHAVTILQNALTSNRGAAEAAAEDAGRNKRKEVLESGHEGANNRHIYSLVGRKVAAGWRSVETCRDEQSMPSKCQLAAFKQQCSRRPLVLPLLQPRPRVLPLSKPSASGVASPGRAAPTEAPPTGLATRKINKGREARNHTRKQAGSHPTPTNAAACRQRFGGQQQVAAQAAPPDPTTTATPGPPAAAARCAAWVRPLRG